MLDIGTECDRGEEFFELQMFYFQSKIVCPFFSRTSLCVGQLLLACLILLFWNRYCDGRILAFGYM